jgi:peptidoglycan-N-acetylglucosamine deacetylase
LNKPTKPIASLSLDLDNQWSYLKIHGDRNWEGFPSYLESVVPRILEFVGQRDLPLTAFVVGQDLVDRANREAIGALAAAGHEIGNHSFSHEPWLHLRSEAHIETEIARTEELIESLVKTRPVGFRGPGYSFSPAIAQVLKRRGYLYDASLLPTWIGPFARAYYFMTSDLDARQWELRRELFGRFRDCFQNVKAHQLGPGFGELWEIPVTTMPLFRVPIHVSYVLYLATISRQIALSYFRLAMSLCCWTGVQPSLLLHPPDFMTAKDAEDLAFLPGMRLAPELKAEVLAEIIDTYSSIFCVVTLKRHAEEVASIASHASEPQQSSAF